jgi:hypothetical protein
MNITIVIIIDANELEIEANGYLFVNTYIHIYIYIIIIDANELEIVAEGGLEPIIQVLYMCICSYNFICK